MKNNVFLSNSTLMGDVAFTSTRNSNFDPNGHDSNGDGVKDTNGVGLMIASTLMN